MSFLAGAYHLDTEELEIGFAVQQQARVGVVTITDLSTDRREVDYIFFAAPSALAKLRAVLNSPEALAFAPPLAESEE